jgi:hypothetical protein
MKKSLLSSLVAGVVCGLAGCASAPEVVEPSTAQTRVRPSASKLDQDDGEAVGFYASRTDRKEPQVATTQRMPYEPPSVLEADEQGRVWDAQRRHYAELRGKRGLQALYVDGRRIWPRSGATTFHGQPVWSPDGHGLAVVEDVSKEARLVVMVEYRDPAGDLTWPIPRDAVSPKLKLFWASDNKVVIGETLMRPRFAANWQRLN